jgi:hypothetical protein
MTFQTAKAMQLRSILARQSLRTWSSDQWLNTQRQCRTRFRRTADTRVPNNIESRQLQRQTGSPKEHKFRTQADLDEKREPPFLPPVTGHELALSTANPNWPQTFQTG